MTDHPDDDRMARLSPLGWTAFFDDQVSPEERVLVPTRIARVHRTRLMGLSEAGSVRLAIPVHTNTADFAVGDWVLAEAGTHALSRRLERRSVLARRVEGSTTPQLAAANVDTLFVVTSQDADFNVDRLERYLALANQGGVDAVILLTKSDVAEDAESFRLRAAALQRDLPVVTLDPRSAAAAAALAPWCGAGRTIALVGSSGVGKSTLVNTLAGPGQDSPQQTGAVREHDAKGRHTTTARSLHAVVGGGWVIDTPGMRTLNVGDTAYGIETLFAEITELAPSCRFGDCTHAHEPGCAVLAAVAAGTLDPDRLVRWRRLSTENRDNTPVATGPRGNRTSAPRPRRR